MDVLLGLHRGHESLSLCLACQLLWGEHGFESQIKLLEHDKSRTYRDVGDSGSLQSQSIHSERTSKALFGNELATQKKRKYHWWKNPISSVTTCSVTALNSILLVGVCQDILRSALV